MEEHGELPVRPKGRHAPLPNAKDRRRGRRPLANPDEIQTRRQKVELLDALRHAKHAANYFKKKAGARPDEEAPAAKATRKRASVKRDVSESYARKRVRKHAKAICDMCDPLPDAERAAVIDRVIRGSSQQVRQLWSSLHSAKVEQFIGARQFLRSLKQSALTCEASLDCRLEVPLSFEKLAKCNTFLSRKTCTDGTLRRIVLMTIPSPVAESRKRGLRSTLFAPAPFRRPQEIRDLMHNQLVDDEITVSDDGKALELNLQMLATECFAVARQAGTLREPPPSHKLRLQYMFDAYRYMRGRGATRWGIRPMDIQHDLSSLMYWRDVAFYSGQDKYEKLVTYCKHAIASLNAGVQVELKFSGNEITGASTSIVLRVGDDLVQVHSGGDAAASSAEGGREGPAGKYGCCAYCVLRKKVPDVRAPSPWFDAQACEQAERRTCWSEHWCRSHERPPGCPPDHNPRCPDCRFECSKSAVQQSQRARDALSASARLQHDRERRRSHAGAEEHRPPLVWLDHKYKVPSALHLLLNGVGTNIAVTLAAGAKPATLKAINAELSRAQHNLYWRVREDKKGRDVRPNGPECRKLLFTPGLIQKLLAIRFACTPSRDDRLPSLQARGSALLQSVSSRATVQPASTSAPPKNKKQPEALTQSRQLDGSAILKALGQITRETAVAATAAPEQRATPAPASSSADPIALTPEELDDGIDADEYEHIFDVPDEAEEDVDSAHLVWSTLVELVLELHEQWNDHDMEERVRRAERAEYLGRQWVSAVRKHSKFTCSHYYCHVAFAHLKELILCNGHLFCGDDAILERGHQQFKRLRSIISSGGKPMVDGQRPTMTMVRQKPVGDALVPRIVRAPIRATAEEQLGKLVRVLTKRRATRPVPVPSAKVIATEIRREEARHAVKRESSLSLKK